MGNKTNPIAFRLGGNREWNSRWFRPRKFKQYLKEDVLLSRWLKENLRRAHVTEVNYQRSSGGRLELTVHTARPGILIGRGGAGIEKVRRDIAKKLSEIRGEHVSPTSDAIHIEVQEVENADANAIVVAQSIAEQLERRMPFRRVLRRTLERVMAAKGVEGAKIAISGRLGGMEMSRREWVKEGRVPLHTLRANIDYAQIEAKTTWGVIGVKVWIYKGEIFDDKKATQGRK